LLAHGGDKELALLHIIFLYVIKELNLYFDYLIVWYNQKLFTDYLNVLSYAK